METIGPEISRFDFDAIRLDMKADILTVRAQMYVLGYDLFFSILMNAECFMN